MQIVTKQRDTQLERLLSSNPKAKKLIKAARSNVDNLLRALIPLYVALPASGVRVTSGGTSRLWAKHGVKISGPAVARALREHVGYARGTKAGPIITPNGLKYIEFALKDLGR